MIYQRHNAEGELFSAFFELFFIHIEDGKS
jgi:hypothetical protein